MSLKSQLARTKKAEAARAVKNKIARRESTIIALKADLAEAQAVIDALEKEATRVQVMLEHLANEDPTNYEKTAALIATDPVARAAYIENDLLQQRNEARAVIGRVRGAVAGAIATLETNLTRMDGICSECESDSENINENWKPCEEWCGYCDNRDARDRLASLALTPAPATEEITTQNTYRDSAGNTRCSGCHADFSVHGDLCRCPAPATEGGEGMTRMTREPLLNREQIASVGGLTADQQEALLRLSMDHDSHGGLVHKAAYDQVRDDLELERKATERIDRYHAEAKERLRTVAQILIEEVGADGPMSAEEAVERAVALIRELSGRVEWLSKDREETIRNEIDRGAYDD